MGCLLVVLVIVAKIAISFGLGWLIGLAICFFIDPTPVIYGVSLPIWLGIVFIIIEACLGGKSGG